MRECTERLHVMAKREKNAFLRCILATFVIGLACHAAVFFSDISFYDDVVCTYDVGTTHIFGRFTLALLGKITRLPFGGSNYSLPWFNGMVSLLFLSIFAWMTVRLLHITCRWMQILTCGILVSFPVMASLFAYGFTAPYYMFALPLCGISAYCFTLRGDAARMEGKRGLRGRLLLLAAGIIVMALMIGIYQAYLPVLLTLEVLILIRDEMEEEDAVKRTSQALGTPSTGSMCTAGDDPAKETGEQTASGGENGRCVGARGEKLSHDLLQNRRWRYALSGTILGFAGYLALMKLSLTLTGKELYAYRGTDSLGMGGSSYLTRILWAYRIFFQPESFEELRGSSDYLLFMWSMGILYRVLLVLILVLAVLGAICVGRQGSAEKRAGRSGLIRYLILTAMFPLMVNFVFVMTDFDVYSMMLYAQVFVFLYPVMMTQMFVRRQGWDLPIPARGLLRILTAVLAMYSILFYCRYDNLCYYKAQRMQDAAIAYDEILIARILSVDGYEASLPVCFVDELEKDVTGWTVDAELAGANITPYTGLEIINCYSWSYFMRVHCGYAPTIIEDYHQYDNYIEEEDMPAYPAEGSIRVIDGVIVVNF